LHRLVSTVMLGSGLKPSGLQGVNRIMLRREGDNFDADRSSGIWVSAFV
jgi:hypothetical protein